MPMNDPKAFMNEYADIASALCEWFESQEIGVGRAVGVMSYLIGVMAAESSVDMNDATDRIQKASVASKLICFAAMQTK